MWRWDGDGCVWQRVSHTAYPEHIETDRIFRYEPYDPDIDMKMNSVTVRDASANGEAFTLFKGLKIKSLRLFYKLDLLSN